MNLLSVDWDYFFVNPLEGRQMMTDPHDLYLYDWGHSESGLLTGSWIWELRAGAFIRWGRELPKTSGEETDFWRRFRFGKKARLYVADSHALLPFCVPNPNAITSVWNFDAHHDTGYGRGDPGSGDFDCGSWAATLHDLCGTEVHVRYPLWKEREDPGASWADVRVYDPVEPLPTFDAAFLCRSGAWTPTWLDPLFGRFAHSAMLPLSRVTRQPDIANPLIPRAFSRAAAEDQAKTMDAVMGGQRGLA